MIACQTRHRSVLRLAVPAMRSTWPLFRARRALGVARGPTTGMRRTISHVTRTAVRPGRSVDSGIRNRLNGAGTTPTPGVRNRTVCLAAAAEEAEQEQEDVDE